MIFKWLFLIAVRRRFDIVLGANAAACGGKEKETIGTDFRLLASKAPLRVIGLMSGTSADGVDAALVDVDDRRVEVIAFRKFPYTHMMRKAIFRLFDPQTSPVNDICHLNCALGELFADAAVRLCADSGIDIASVDLIASHGQTIYHDPLGRRSGRKLIRSTLQIAEPCVIAERTGVTTVADFRPRDMASGGEGAPLVPYADYVLFGGHDRCRAIQNIGGIANVTYLPPRCGIDDIIAFDTGPGNMVIDRMAELLTAGRMKYDRNGAMAAKGAVDPDLLDHLLSHPFLRRRPPKSTGREEFGLAYADVILARARASNLSSFDIMATLTAFTVRSITRAYRKFLPAMPDELILCGGGANNPTIVGMLQQDLPGVQMLRTDDFGIGVDAKEAVSFAILAAAAVKGTTNNVPAATGAARAVVCGKIIPA